jgi:hypothetical protein
MTTQQEFELTDDQLETLANKLDSLDLTDSERAILTTLFGGARNFLGERGSEVEGFGWGPNFGGNHDDPWGGIIKFPSGTTVGAVASPPISGSPGSEPSDPSFGSDAL